MGPVTSYSGYMFGGQVPQSTPSGPSEDPGSSWGLTYLVDRGTTMSERDS